MVMSTSQQVVVAFTAVLFTFVVLPRMFGVGGGTKETRGVDQRYSRKAGLGPGAARGQPVGMLNNPGSAQTAESLQQMKMMMEQEMKSDKSKYKSNNGSNKGYVFTLMPLYAIGVGVFAAYKFLKIKSADDSHAQKNNVAKGAKKSAEAENQLNELEQRLAQTERMLNSILTQLDPLTNCVKSVAQEQKNEIMSQLQTIRCLMKKRGMNCPPLDVHEAPGGRHLDDLIESLAARDTVVADVSPDDDKTSEQVCHDAEEILEEPEREVEEDGDMVEEEEDDGEEEEELDDSELISSLSRSEQPASGLRRRARYE